MTLSDDAKAVVALASRLGDSGRPSLSPTRWHRLHSILSDQSIEVREVFSSEFDPSEIPGLDGADASTIRELIESAPAATVAASDLEHLGIDIVTILDESYPDALRRRLGDLAPPVLFTVGERSLLDGEGIGIVGSRDITEDGRHAAEAIATTAAGRGLSVVSGAARGVDTFAMNAAFLEGGSVIGVVADSLQARIRRPEVLSAIDSGSICLISQQHPATGFSAGSAMSRNKVVYALTTTTVVISSDLESGGTWAGATEALTKRLADVAVWMGPGTGPGNSRLVELSGRAVTTSSEVFEGSDPIPDPVEQLSFGQ